jgi:hypothetical protein
VEDSRPVGTDKEVWVINDDKQANDKVGIAKVRVADERAFVLKNDMTN